MMGLKESSVGRSDEFKVPLDLLYVEPGWNARDLDDAENKQSIAELAESIKDRGIVKALTVVFKNDKVFIRDGHRRLAAALYANEHLGANVATANCVTLARGANDADYLVLQLLEDKAKTPLEQGAIFKRLMAYGDNNVTIALKVGRSVSHVNHCLDLQAAPHEVHALIKEGKGSSTLAAKVTREHGEDAPRVLNNAVDRATQKGKGKATAADVGQEPKLPKKQRLTRLAELFDASEGTIVDDLPVGVSVRFTDSAWHEIVELLGI